ncbi:MAG: histidine phosphatase family protein [Mycobacteriales bacterium]
MGELLLARHGETDWSRTLRHTGRTDVPLSRRGTEQARALRSLLAGRHFALVLASPLRRARDTAELALATPQVATDARLVEWDYGQLEGVTTEDWHRDHPGWALWADGCPGGESLGDVVGRVEDLLDSRIRPMLGTGDVLLVAHGHLLRVLTVRMLGLPGAAAAHFVLEPATLAVLGSEHGTPAILRWNLPPPGAALGTYG